MQRLAAAWFTLKNSLKIRMDLFFLQKLLCYGNDCSYNWSSHKTGGELCCRNGIRSCKANSSVGMV